MNSRALLNLRATLPQIVSAALIVALGLALAWLPWAWAILLVIGSIALLGLLIRPQYILALLAFAVPFGSMRELNLGPMNVSATDLLVGLLFVFWIARMIATRRVVIRPAPLLLPLLAFLVAISLSTLGAASLELSAKEIFKWVEVLIIYLFVVNLDSPTETPPRKSSELDGRWIKALVWALLAAGSAEALVGIYQFVRRVGPPGFLLFGRFMRAYGHFAQPNPFAGYLGLTIPLAYALTLAGLDARRFQALPGKSAIRQMLKHAAAMVAFVLMTAAMIMSWSRGGWVGLAAALLVMTMVRSRSALILAILIGLLVAYGLLAGGAQYLPPTLLQRVADFFPYIGGIDVSRVQVTDANFALVERMAHWLAAVGMFADHPWLGVGIGNYPVAYAHYAIGRWRDPLGHAHNYYLNVAAEAGIIGLAAYLILLGACLLQAWRGIQRTHGYWRAVALGALGVLVHLAVHSVFDNLYVHSMNVQLGLVLGLLAVVDQQGRCYRTSESLPLQKKNAYAWNAHRH